MVLTTNGVAKGQKLRVAIIGQSAFAAEVYKLIQKDGHKVVGVFTVPDNGNREDPAATIAAADGTPVFKLKSWRLKGVVLPEVFEQYKSVDADLNVLPFCTQFIPMEVINYPKHKSICYHPSILPKHRGVSSISWTLIEGDTEAGFTIFWADDGLDTGPILLQRTCPVEPNDTLDLLYNKFMYPEGIKGMAQAVNMVADGSAPVIIQPEDGASYDPALKKKELTLINWDQTAKRIHDFIRGLDSSPGALALINGVEVKLFGSTLWHSALPDATEVFDVAVEGMKGPGLVHKGGLLLHGSDGHFLNVERLHVEGRMIPANRYGKTAEKRDAIDMTAEEKEMLPVLRDVWASILRMDIEDDTDFFASGAQSMDVVRLVEEIKERFNLELQNEDVFLATTFSEFAETVVLKSRGSTSKEIAYDAVVMHANNMDVKFPKQLFIDGEFVNAEGGRTIESINPADESVICAVQRATVGDVDRAVRAAHRAFHESEWSKMSARDRGRLLFRLADLMEEHKQELATIESIDSGAVYTLALKTHVGMSIDVWRYFAGWCDKITGSTIPISHARPNRNLTFTRKEPIGVCGLVTPWNYPLMMLSWKMAACLAAGNTVVMKPAQVSPLTALKFAELSVKAGIPAGVINIVPGSGGECGNAIATHPLVRKLGFTGSTEVGQTIMRSCADSNLKKCSLELGGKSPLVIFDDCDLDRAVRYAMSGVFFNKGENCIAAGRLFVQDTIHDKFVDRVIQETRKIVIGDPLSRSTTHGPQNHKAHLDKLVDYVQRAVQDGATLRLGGKRIGRPGLFFEPTVLTDVEDDMWVAKEESFGPIMIISQFSGLDLDTVIKRANNTEFGLASGVFTRDINRAMAFAEKIEAGTVFINTYNKTDVAAPFGGFKQSGFGKDLGEEALNEYLKTKCITLEY